MDSKRMLMPGDFIELYTLEEFERIYYKVSGEDEYGRAIFFNGDVALFRALGLEEANARSFEIYIQCIPFGETLRVHKAYSDTVTVVDNKSETGYYPYTIDKHLIKKVKFNIP